MLVNSKKVCIAILSTVMAICLTLGLVLFFAQAPIAFAAETNAASQSVVAYENDFEYSKDDNNKVVVTGLSKSFVNKYIKGGSQNPDGTITFNVRLEIPETLKNAHGRCGAFKRRKG